jgi:hypothetical protein
LRFLLPRLLYLPALCPVALQVLLRNLLTFTSPCRVDRAGVTSCVTSSVCFRLCWSCLLPQVQGPGELRDPAAVLLLRCRRRDAVQRGGAHDAGILRPLSPPSASQGPKVYRKIRSRYWWRVGATAIPCDEEVSLMLAPCGCRCRRRGIVGASDARKTDAFTSLSFVASYAPLLPYARRQHL